MNDYRSVLSQYALIITEWYGLLESQESGRCIRDVGPPQSLVLGLLISPAKPSLLWLPQIPVLNGSIQFLIIRNQHTIHLWKHNSTSNGPVGTCCTSASCFPSLCFCRSFQIISIVFVSIESSILFPFISVSAAGYRLSQ
jgi:hypothetical protein